ncbi:Golgi phosphoprotein 3 (GPP34) [Geodermatophilus saharensis]|uniref:Golgi phosphoprotein 3 (GPP34) n=1 Tax=Geodermatophilus saharensis TaxID=1137994 RepID=A0A239GKE7_9ACTN|nr:hypothetical protein [Geodermatophilus saharensis]SNS69461.1 Golgi phosphoprotein 3 (GPP34) [Geodermatophilus saharensis]
MDDWDGSTSMRLACLALDGRGRLTDDLVTALAVRGTLLVDLALRDRLAETEDAVGLDGRPTGFPPADRLLAGAAGSPGSLADLLRRGRVDQHDLAAEHLRRGSWTRRGRWSRRYVDHRAARTRDDERAMTAGPDHAWSPDDAALAAVASTLGVLATDRALPTEALLAAAGPVRWVVEVVVAEVDRALARGRALRRAVTSADGTPG